MLAPLCICWVVSLYYCWWKKSCTTWDVQNPVNNGIYYPSVGPDTEAWLHKFMGPLLFPALYPPTCISKIFLRPEPCKWTPASASEKGKNVVAPAPEPTLHDHEQKSTPLTQALQTHLSASSFPASTPLWSQSNSQVVSPNGSSTCMGRLPRLKPAVFMLQVHAMHVTCRATACAQVPGCRRGQAERRSPGRLCVRGHPTS